MLHKKIGMNRNGAMLLYQGRENITNTTYLRTRRITSMLQESEISTGERNNVNKINKKRYA
jgi:hypothetical protein